MKIQAGVSLLELVIIIAILGVVTLVAAPNLSITDPLLLDRTAEQVANALRYARSESLRTGEPHGVLVDQKDVVSEGKDITVIKLDLEQDPFGIDRYLYHPVTKRRYDLALNELARLPALSFTSGNPPFDIETLGKKSYIHFTGIGVPVWFEGGIPYRLLSCDIRLGNGWEERIVTLDPATGRVTVQ